MDTTVRDITLRTAETGELQEVWRRAERTDLVRTVLRSLLAAVLAGSLRFVNVDRWPPRLHQPLWGYVPGMLLVTGLFFVVFVGVTCYQKRTAPRCYVSPVLGLDPEGRRAAEAALRTATPSSDPGLREVETATAEQRVRTAPRSLGVALITPAIYVGVTAVMFAAGTPFIGVLWIAVTVWTTMTALWNVRAGKKARSYLDHLRETSAAV